MSDKLDSIVISNIAEAYHRIYRKKPEEFEERIRYDFLESERALFYAQDNKAVITSSSVESQFIDDIKKILNFSKIINLYPINPTYKLCHDIIQDKNLYQRVEDIIRDNPGIDLIPYYATEEFFDLVAFLKQKDLKFTTPETVLTKNRFIRDHYNCKVGFRKLWEKVSDEHSFVKIPQGFIVDDLSEAIDASWWFVQQKMNFVVKYNRGTSGFGIVFYDLSQIPRNEKEFKKFMRTKHEDRIWYEENFVVEEMIDIDREFFGGSPSIEYKINGEVRHLYNCLQRLDENNFFQGAIISKKAEDDSDIDYERVVDNCAEYGDALEELGYRGIFDIDLVVDKKHNIYAVESNLRRTGVTHVFETAQHLFGRNFEQKTVVASRDDLKVSPEIKTYSDLKNRCSDLYFSMEKKSGIVPTISSFLSMGKLGYIVFGKTMKDLELIESDFINRIS